MAKYGRLFSSWFFLPMWPLRCRLCASLYHGPYFTTACRGTERLYCGDSNGHVGFESFSSHISLTPRTPVLFIPERLTATGHGMKYILSSRLINNPGERRRKLQSVFIYQRRREERERGGRYGSWRTISWPDWGGCWADCRKRVDGCENF